MADNPSDNGPSDTAVRIATTVAALAAAFVVQRALAMGWRAITGHSAPRADDGEVSPAEIITYTALSAAAVATARVFATRKAHSLVKRQATA